jgi:hypothetical protein
MTIIFLYIYIYIKPLKEGQDVSLHLQEIRNR